MLVATYDLYATGIFEFFHACKFFFEFHLSLLNSVSFSLNFGDVEVRESARTI